jgi:hypothetical protein
VLGAGDWGCGDTFLPFDFCLLPLDLPVRAVPHSPQNFAVGLTSRPQLGQARTSLVPHSSQNFVPSGLAKPQFLHSMLIFTPLLTNIQLLTLALFFWNIFNW